jgi:hypothetical protein
MSEERPDQEQTQDEEDVEAHKATRMANQEPAGDDESEEVEAHLKRMQHKNA